MNEIASDQCLQMRNPNVSRVAIITKWRVYVDDPVDGLDGVD